MIEKLRSARGNVLFERRLRINERENTQFNNNLRTIYTILKMHNIQYSLVGGLAMKAILGEEINARRKNGTIYDFDAVALGPDKGTINDALEELERAKKGKKMFPEIGIEPINFSDSPIAPKPFALLSSMRKNNKDDYFLTYREIEMDVPPETIKLETVLLNGIEFPCFPPKTILYRYLVRGGMMKEKDDGKLVKLTDFIVAHEHDQLDDSLYAPYLEFAEQIRARYPLPINVFDLFWKLDHLMGDGISGSAGFIYGLIHLFRES